MIEKKFTSIYISYFGYGIEFIIPTSKIKWQSQIISIFKKNFGGYIYASPLRTHVDLRIKFTAEKNRAILDGGVYTYLVPTVGISLEQKKFGQLLKEIIIASMLLLAKKKGVCLHASSVSYLGKAVVFIGDSGSGKSTICQLLAPTFTQLTDDATFLMKVSTWRTSPLPIFEKAVPLRTRTSSESKLTALCFLRKAEHDRIIKLKKDRRVFNQLINNIFHTGSPTELLALHNLMQSPIPIYQIEFKKENTIKTILKKLIS